MGHCLCHLHQRHHHHLPHKSAPTLAKNANFTQSSYNQHKAKKSTKLHALPLHTVNCILLFLSKLAFNLPACFKLQTNRISVAYFFNFNF